MQKISKRIKINRITKLSNSKQFKRTIYTNNNKILATKTRYRI